MPGDRSSCLVGGLLSPAQRGLEVTERFPQHFGPLVERQQFGLGPLQRFQWRLGILAQPLAQGGRAGRQRGVLLGGCCQIPLGVGEHLRCVGRPTTFLLGPCSIGLCRPAGGDRRADRTCVAVDQVGDPVE